MEYVHDCFFCGWRRTAQSATVLQPRCRQCGCAVRSAPRPDLESPAADPVPPDAKQPTSGVALAGRIGAGLFAMLAAAHTGYVEAGPAIALAAFGAAGLASVPVLVPSR
jgi:hypothetical protein